MQIFLWEISLPDMLLIQYSWQKIEHILRFVKLFQKHLMDWTHSPQRPSITTRDHTLVAMVWIPVNLSHFPDTDRLVLTEDASSRYSQSQSDCHRSTYIHSHPFIVAALSLADEQEKVSRSASSTTSTTSCWHASRPASALQLSGSGTNYLQMFYVSIFTTWSHN